MKATITVTDHQGNAFEGSVILSPVGRRTSGERKPTKASRIHASPAQLAYDMNVRAFMKKYAKPLKGGARRLTALVARLAKGKVGHQVTTIEVQKHWNSMTTVVGGDWNGAHASRALEYGWIDSPKRGTYVLAKDWAKALS